MSISFHREIILWQFHYKIKETKSLFLGMTGSDVAGIKFCLKQVSFRSRTKQAQTSNLAERLALLPSLTGWVKEHDPLLLPTGYRSKFRRFGSVHVIKGWTPQPLFPREEPAQSARALQEAPQSPRVPGAPAFSTSEIPCQLGKPSDN